MCLIRNTELLCNQCRGIGPHLTSRGSLLCFLKLRQESGVYSQVTVGMAIRNSNLLNNVRTPVQLREPPEKSELGLAR